MTPFEWFLTGLAVWRVSSLLVHEDGPKAVFVRLRTLAGRSELFYQLLQCVWCTSVWVGAGFLALWWLAPQLARVLSLWLSFSALAIAWQQICRNDLGNEFLTLAKAQDRRERRSKANGA